MTTIQKHKMSTAKTKPKDLKMTSWPHPWNCQDLFFFAWSILCVMTTISCTNEKASMRSTQHCPLQDLQLNAQSTSYQNQNSSNYVAYRGVASLIQSCTAFTGGALASSESTMLQLCCCLLGCLRHPILQCFDWRCFGFLPTLFVPKLKVWWEMPKPVH